MEQLNPDAILDSISDGIIAVGLDWRILYINRAARELLGLEGEQVIGLPCDELVRFDICSNNCLLRRTMILGESVSNFEMVIKNREGASIPVSINTALLKDNQGKVVGSVEIFRDISLIKELSEKLQEKYSFGNIIGKNHRMREIYQLLPQVAQSRATVLLQGESGTGKELVAAAIHENSPRRHKPFVKVNCAALAEGVLESELFGHVRGAFTGAVANKPGRFELADGGTIFLDEIGDLSSSTQSKLLRVLAEGEFERVGGIKKIQVDVRVIAATNKDLARAIKEGTFREDLYYRLKVVVITLPALRERKDDIPLLLNHFMARFNKEMGKEINNLSPQARELLLNYDYPGNVRELENVLEHAFVSGQGNTILPEHLPGDLQNPGYRLVEAALRERDPLKALERQLIVRTLHQSAWKYKEAAQRLGINYTTLWRKMKALNIAAP